MPNDIPLIDKKFYDLNPLIVGSEQCEPGHSYGPAVREYYLIHYVVSGCGRLYLGEKLYSVKGGEIFLIRPGELSTYRADQKDPWHYIWIGFNGHSASQLDALPAPVLPYRNHTFFTLLTCSSLTNTREEFAASCLFEMMSVLLEGNAPGSSYEQRAADYIRANYMRPIRIEKVAETIGLNRRYLSRIFKKQYHITMQQYLAKTRLEHSLGLLRAGYPVSQAAQMSGYEDAFHFSKMFKKHFGVSPQNFQKKACF